MEIIENSSRFWWRLAIESSMIIIMITCELLSYDVSEKENDGVTGYDEQ